MVKKILILICVLGSFVNLSARQFVLANDTTDMALKTVYVNGQARIKMVMTDTLSFKVLTDDEKVLKSVKCDYQNGKLRINNSCDEMIHILITAPCEFPVIKTNRNYTVIEHKRKRRS